MYYLFFYKYRIVKFYFDFDDIVDWFLCNIVDVDGLSCLFDVVCLYKNSIGRKNIVYSGREKGLFYYF